MEKDKDFVSEEVCAERQKNADERFSRDKERLDKIEERQDKQEEREQKIETLNIQMGEILKNHNSKLENHDQRIGALESRPMKFWDKLQWLVIGAVTSGLISMLISSILK